MAKSALKLNSTQKFIEIIDVFDEVIVLSGGNAASIIEVQATNFELLSAEEQDAKIYAYSSLLNSLSFPIQIVIRSKKLDVSSYLNTLEIEAQRAPGQGFANQIRNYKKFVSELVKVNVVLDKRFYIVVPYTSLEAGALGAKQIANKNALAEFSQTAKSALGSKTEAIHTQLGRIGLKAKTLYKDDVVRVFYNIFNDVNLEHPHQVKEAKSPIVKGGQK